MNVIFGAQKGKVESFKGVVSNLQLHNEASLKYNVLKV